MPDNVLRLGLSLVRDEDVPYEMQLIDNPDELNSWLRYYWHRNSPIEKLFVLQRACYHLRRSYKLWILYLDEYCEIVRPLSPEKSEGEYLKLNNEFEKALELLYKMPVLWVKYLEFLMLQTDINLVRRKFNEALRALPLTQHHWIWPLFLKFADDVHGEAASAIYQRYLIYNPEAIELVLEKLIDLNDIDASIQVFLQIINDETYISKQGSSSLDLWLQFFDLLSRVKNPTLKHDSLIENYIRFGFEKFPDQQGKLYVKLATYFIKRKSYEKSISIFREGLTHVLTIRDFTMVYDTYSEFQESIVQNLATKIKEEEENDGSQGRLDQLNGELDFNLDKFEKLMDDREYLLSDVKIRQNPNDVSHWLNKIELFPKDQISKILQTYVEAITKIDPKRATPGLHKIWTQYSAVYEESDLNTARVILDKAVKVPFNSPDGLVEIWIYWSELELRQDDLDTAIKVLEVATRNQGKKSKTDYNDGSLTAQERIHKSIKLWSFYLDLVESSEDVPKTCEIYEKVFELRIATPLTVVNYANFLESVNRFEEAFKVYEKGISIFKYPTVFEIWNIYLTKAMKRDWKLERLRDLFDHALDDCPEEKDFYILYSSVEEERGSVSKSLKILSKGIDHVSKLEFKCDLFELAIVKSREHFGLLSTRSIFTKAIEQLPPQKSITFVINFAKVEEELHEYSRVRAILQHGALLQSPLKSTQMWDWWSEFEVNHGDKDTYKDMLRWKRKANDEFGVDFNSEQLGFVKSTEGPKVSSINASEQIVENPEEIDLDI